MKPEPLFYIARAEQDSAGPYDLVQMAGLLRKKVITADTLTRMEGDEGWQPFSLYPQFMVAREMSPDAVSARMEVLDEEARKPISPIPLPSPAFMVQAGVAAVLMLVGMDVAYWVALADVTTGICIVVVSLGAAAVGGCMIYVRLLDEDYMVVLMVMFVPFFDVYYFLSNIEVYLPYFLAKYAGTALALAAVAGLHANPAFNAH